MSGLRHAMVPTTIGEDLGASSFGINAPRFTFSGSVADIAAALNTLGRSTAPLSSGPCRAGESPLLPACPPTVSRGGSFAQTQQTC